MSYTQTQERLSLEEFLNFTETNWTVTKEPLVTQQGWETDSFGIFREDNNAYLGTVGRVYTPTQNRELLELLYQACDNVGINLSRGGFLGNGSRVFYQMEVGNIQIGASQVQRYITVLNTHNGRSPIGFGSTNITVVCRNTFYRALNDLSKVKHTPTSMTRLTILVEAMSEALERENALMTEMQEMSGISVPATIDDDFLRAVLEVEINTRSDRRLELLKQDIRTDFNIHGENKWGLLNGFTRFTTHTDKVKDRRRSIVEGTGFKINNRAFELIQAL